MSGSSQFPPRAHCTSFLTYFSPQMRKKGRSRLQAMNGEACGVSSLFAPYALTHPVLVANSRHSLNVLIAGALAHSLWSCFSIYFPLLDHMVDNNDQMMSDCYNSLFVSHTSLCSWRPLGPLAPRWYGHGDCLFYLSLSSVCPHSPDCSDRLPARKQSACPSQNAPYRCHIRRQSLGLLTD